LISYHDDVKRNQFFTQLINLRQKGPVIKNIQQFQKLSLRVDGMPNDKLLDLFIGTLKDNIQHEVHLFEPTSLKKDFMVARKVESRNMVMATRRITYKTYRENIVPYSNPPQPTRLTLQQMDKRREKGICFNCDNNYSKGHKCGKNKLFYIDCEEEEAKEHEPSQTEEIGDISPKEITPAISYHALARISTPQLDKVLNCFIYPTPKFQVMILDGGTINCSGKCHNINLTMGEYVLNSPMITIPMGGVDVVLGVQWLQSLGTVAFNFQEFFIKLSWEGKGFELRGITGKPSKVIGSNGMTKLLKKGHQGIIAIMFTRCSDI
jgi:hypothetical protein